MFEAFTCIILIFGTLLLSVFLIYGVITFNEYNKAPYLKSISKELKKLNETFEKNIQKSSDHEEKGEKNGISTKQYALLDL